MRSKGLTQQTRMVRDAPLLGGNRCLIRASRFTWGLGPHRIVYANKVTDGGGLAATQVARVVGRGHVTDLRENPGHSPGEPPCLAVLHVRCRTSAVPATTLGEDNW